MNNYYSLVKNYLTELEYDIIGEISDENVLIIDNPDQGIHNLTIVIDDPIIIMEQFLVEISNPSFELLAILLQKNRDIVHGAFALADGNKLIFRDTLQVENLDLNELEASLNALTLLMTECAELLKEIA